MYPRGAVVPLKTAETWMRTEGRSVKPGSQPLKMIKLRASTVGKMREVEVLREAGSGGGEATGASEVMQGLYARSQTEKFVPDPVIDVSFTIVRFRFPVRHSLYRALCQKIILAISIYTFLRCFLKGRSMCHVSDDIPCLPLFTQVYTSPLDTLRRNICASVKGVAKIARTLGFDYAEAVVGPCLYHHG